MVITIATVASGWIWVGVVGLGGIFSLVAFVVPAARVADAERRAGLVAAELREAEVKLRLTVSDALLPVLSSTVNGVDPLSCTLNDVAAAETLAMALGTVVQLCGGCDGRRVRACWYQARKLDSDNAGLYPTAYFGRGADKPSTEFRRAEPRGQALFRLLAEDRTELFNDLDTVKPPDWKTSACGPSSYKATMQVPVRTDSQIFGMITVDADRPGVFTKADVDLVRLLAAMLALALSHQRQPTIAPVRPVTETSR